MGRQGPLCVGRVHSSAAPPNPATTLIEWEQVVIMEAREKFCPGVMGKLRLPQNSYVEALPPSVS